MTAPVRIVPREAGNCILPVMDRAFHDDPTVRWYHRGAPGLFSREHHRYVQLCADAAFGCGGVHATPDHAGAAVWYGPGDGVSDRDFEAFVDSVHFPDRMRQLGDLAHGCDAHRPQEPHWTLELLAVDPEAQNGGVGRGLMAFGLDRTDRAGMPVFLASSNPDNLPFYDRLGFVQVADVSLSGMPHMYPMIRQPGGPKC